jgi:hypothetical protein
MGLHFFNIIKSDSWGKKHRCPSVLFISEESDIFIDNDQKRRYKDDAGYTAATHILPAGQAVSVCGDIGRVTVQAQKSFLL